LALYQAVLAYDGTDFVGFQRQREGRTVQGVVESALRRLGWQEEAIRYAGRTDAGVHARGQVIAFRLRWQHGAEALRRALNSLLPPDVAVSALRPAPADFHPRYAAVARRYVYRLYVAAERRPLWRRYAWRVWPALDGDLLAAAAALFPGRRDFAALGTPPSPQGTTVRTVYKAAWASFDEGLWVFDVVADAFLYRMVRRMVALQVAVAQGRMPLESVKQALDQPPAAPLQGLAPPQGLVLQEVCYASEELARCRRETPPVSKMLP